MEEHFWQWACAQLSSLHFRKAQFVLKCSKCTHAVIFRKKVLQPSSLNTHCMHACRLAAKRENNLKTVLFFIAPSNREAYMQNQICFTRLNGRTSAWHKTINYKRFSAYITYGNEDAISATLWQFLDKKDQLNFEQF